MTGTSAPRVAVVGAGAWGTALAVHLCLRAHARPAVTLLARDAATAQILAGQRENARYLPGIALPPALTLGADLAAARDASLVIVATPVSALAAVLVALAAEGCRAPLVWLSKGFITSPDGRVTLAHQALAAHWPAAVGTISGPTFADEVARGLPAAVAVATTDPRVTEIVAALVRADTLRAYASQDLAGVETGGAVKNVLAIAAGASDGLGYGHNARAALITRGLAETGRLSAALGGTRDTLMGLAGLGDLALTCTSDLSRNRRVGIALAQGQTLAEAMAGLGHVAEGVFAAVAVRTLATQHGIDMPICAAVWRVVHDGVPVREAVGDVLRREPRRDDG